MRRTTCSDLHCITLSQVALEHFGFYQPRNVLILVSSKDVVLGDFASN